LVFLYVFFVLFVAIPQVLWGKRASASPRQELFAGSPYLREASASRPEITASI
jgi:hypothetical protein